MFAWEALPPSDHLSDPVKLFLSGVFCHKNEKSNQYRALSRICKKGNQKPSIAYTMLTFLFKGNTMTFPDMKTLLSTVLFSHINSLTVNNKHKLHGTFPV